MEITKIKELLEPFVGESGLGGTQLKQVQDHLALLLKWNAKMNLTAVRDPQEIIARHFGESFLAARALLGEPSKIEAQTVIDLGSGAGFPGLSIAIYAENARVTLIESQKKKATFLKEVVRTLGLPNVTVFGGRGEEYPGKAELVTLRAVEKFKTAAEVAGALVAPGGQLGLMIGVGQEKELPQGFQWQVGKAVTGASSRVLAVGKKMEESR